MFSLPIYFIFFLGFFSYIYGKNRSKKKISFNKNSGGQPSHYGYYCLIWVTVPSIIFLLLWQVISNHLILIATINSIPPEVIPKDSNLKNRSLKLKTDEKEFKLLFFNILDNAFKYSSSLVKIFLEETTKNIKIIFQDNGIGIPKSEINRVTERFYRVKGNKKIKGSGLGLAIVLEIINNHEGEVKIESEEKVGTKVSLIFKRV